MTTIWRRITRSRNSDEVAERPEVHRLMKRALLHESEPNLLKHIYHIVFRRNYIGQI